MATSQSLTYEAYYGMERGQRMAWFYETSFNIRHRDQAMYLPANVAISSYMDITVPDEDASNGVVFNKTIRKVMKALALGQRSHEDLMFVQIDSSVACYHRVNDIIKNLKNKFPTCIPVLVKTATNNAESIYKFVNSDKYDNVCFDKLQDNINLFEEDEDVDMIEDTIATIDYPMSIEFEFLDNIMKDLIDKGYGWGEGGRNEVNDDVQIETLLSILDFIPGCSVIMFTHDRKMQEKIKARREQVAEECIFIGTASYIF